MVDVYDQAVRERFRQLVEQSNGCWIFTGGTTNNEGVPLFSFGPSTGPGRRRVVAQRVAWEMKHGPLPRGQVVLASCGDQRCVNLKHLSVGTKGEREPEEKIRERFWSRVAPANGDACRPWLSYSKPNGYGSFPYRGRLMLTHRLAWSFAHDEPVPDGLFVCHRCDNPPCCNPDHLFVAPAAGNSADMVAKGRARGGPRPKTMKLTDEQVREIRQRYAAGEGGVHALAEDYPVTAMVVWKVATGRSYKHVT